MCEMMMIFLRSFGLVCLVVLVDGQAEEWGDDMMGR
jgi:hypothetical protein